MTVATSNQKLTSKFVHPGSSRNPPRQTAQAVTQQILESGQGKLAQLCQEGRIPRAHPLPVLLSQLIEQARRLGEIRRRLCQRDLGSRETLRQIDQTLVTDVIPGQPPVIIAFVTNPGQTMRLGIGLDLAARNIEQRAQDSEPSLLALHRHGRRTSHPGAAQEIMQDCFCLIAPMMRQQNAINVSLTKYLITRRPRRGLKPQTAPETHGNPANGERNAQAIAIGGTKIRPCIGVGRKPMMDMHRREGKTWSETVQKMRQNNRVAPTREPHAKTLSGFQAGGEKNADPLDEISRRPVP